MELQALLVLCGVGVAGVAVILLMSLFSSSGTSYEEAIAQQRKATTELLALADNKNKAKKTSKKAIKKLAKKEKSKEYTQSNISEAESEAPAESGADEDIVPLSKPHVEFSPPIVVDVPRDSPLNIKIRKRGKDAKVKPILVNKEDPSCVNDPSVPPSPSSCIATNHFEEIHPKDEFELMHTLHADKTAEKKEEILEKKDSKPNKSKNKSSNKPLAPATVKDDQQNIPEEPKEQRKPKKNEKKSISEDLLDAPQEEVVPPLNVAQPIELMTDKLLKQALSANAAVVNSSPSSQPAGKKNKKKQEQNNVLALMAGDSSGVNVSELVRYVREAPFSRTEIQILTDTLLDKHHDQLPAHSDWSEGPNDPVQKMKKQLADKEKALTDEIEASQALHAKLKELRTSLNAERSRAGSAEAAVAAARGDAAALQARLQRALDEHHAISQEMRNLQVKLSADNDFQAQRVQMEMHIQRLSESESALMAQLGVLQAEAGARAVEAGQARLELIAAQQHAHQQIQEVNRACAELEQQRQRAVAAEQRAQQQLQERINTINELQGEVQRLTTRAQSTEGNLDKIKEESEKQTNQMLTEIASLKEQILSRDTELSELKQLKVVALTQNGLQNNAAGDQIKASELAKVESVVESLKNELASAQKCNKEQREQLSSLNEQLKLYQDKNNELRTKNWKVMEALQSAEKALQSKASSASPAQDPLSEAITKAQEAQYVEIATILRSACPSAAPSSAVNKNWLQSFASNLKKELQKQEVEIKEIEKRVSASNSAPAQDSRVDELLNQNEQLQGLVDKYKRIIDDTEGVLSRLQQNVTTEEQKWAQQLSEKQRELDDLRDRTLTQMQKKIDSLQDELKQSSKASNHSFADAERQTEERLMSGISEKLLDSRNGPLQVGLNQK